MVAIDTNVDTIWSGVDFPVSLNYEPPAGEDVSEIEISAALFGPGLKRIDATSLDYDRQTGEILASWDEETTRKLVVNGEYETRFIRSAGGQTRVFYVCKAKVR